MADRQRGQRNILQIPNDSDLMECYRLDRAGIMVVVDLIKDELTSSTAKYHNNASNEGGHNITKLSPWKTATVQQ